ncbi:MAG TPA: VOC family protein [Solirubrobacteraceae bacterium]|nr:VOC family protein [Solirubrobacteraceae bacterium]
MTIYPSLRYRDARAAIDWLAEAYGFEEMQAHADDEGIVRHAEIRGFGGIVMLGTEPEGGDPLWGEHTGQGWMYLSTDDVDALHDRAVAAGAEIVRPLQDTDYGSREFSSRDPEGNVWSFGTYAP